MVLLKNFLADDQLQSSIPPGFENPTHPQPGAEVWAIAKGAGLLGRCKPGAGLGWEKGNFKPREEKAAQLAALAKKGKEDVRKLLGEKMAKEEAKPKPNRAKRRSGTSPKVAKPPKK